MNRKMMAEIKIEREVKTYYDLNHASYVLLEKSKKNLEPDEDGKIPGNYYTTMASLIFTAFTLEAYLNHLGSEKIKFWDDIEPKRIKDKFKVLAKEFNIKIDYGCRPYQTISSLLQFRNALAHGKSKIINETKIAPADTNMFKNHPKTKWEEYCTEDNAIIARDDVNQIINELHKNSRSSDHPSDGGITISTMSLKK
jgi:hypothetical protein